MVGTSPSSCTDKGCQREHFCGVFVFQHGLLSLTTNFAASSTAPSYIIIEMLSEEVDFGVYAQLIVINVMMKSNL